MPGVVFLNLDIGLQTIDAAAHVRQEHKNVRAMVARGKGELDGADLPAVLLALL
jgi:hypothetical protein